MRKRLRTRYWAVLGAAAAALAASFAAAGGASPPDDPSIANVPTANVKAAGYAPWNRLAAGLQDVAVAQGSTRVENPQNIVTDYGYTNDTPSPDDPSRPQMVPASLAAPTEAQKTEPDKNTYLVFKHGLAGADPNYDYGDDYLFQGHEVGARIAGSTQRQSYITRINLDADAQHRVTVLASQDSTGQPIQGIDGSTWDPWAQRLLFTTENTAAPTYAATPNYPSVVTDVSGALGRGGYEGIQDDSNGDIWIVEDIGGPNKQGTPARQPNSFIYRYVPRRPGDLQNGKLQALQVLKADGTPITFESQAPLMAPDQVALNTYGNVFDTRWVTIHDTATDGNAPFVANPLAKAAHATPFKRPENGVFRPGIGFREFYFTATGDTNATSPENGDPTTGAGGACGWDCLYKLWQPDPSSDTGKITLFYEGNESVAGMDNIQFLSKDQFSAVEDAGDTLHTQRKALDSGFVFNVKTNYANRSNQPTRWLAEGRDPSATLDSANGGFGKNEGDNEITGIHVSNGDPRPEGVLGSKVPHLFDGGWRWFWTQQHGDNYTYEVIPANRSNDESDWGDRDN